MPPVLPGLGQDHPEKAPLLIASKGSGLPLPSSYPSLLRCLLIASTLLLLCRFSPVRAPSLA